MATTMKLRHATTRQRLASILEQGLRVECADPQAKLKGCWLHAPSRSAWAMVHTLLKHRVDLVDVVLIEVTISRKHLNHFRTGLWYAPQDVPASALGTIWDGAMFGASASE